MGQHRRRHDQATVGASVTALTARTTALEAFDTSLGQSGGSNLIGFINSGTGAFARSVQSRLRETVSVKDFNAAGDGTADDTAEIQAAITSASGRTVNFPAGTYVITALLTVPTGTMLCGAGSQATYLVFRNCNGFDVQGDAVTIRDMYIWSQSAAGVPDPKTRVGIQVSGVNGAKRAQFIGERLYLRGWNACVQWDYTWISSLLQCVTVNCNNSLFLIGQSVNNYVTNCELVANTGTAAIACVKDTSAGSNNKGEGLMVTNTLLASAANCVNASDFLSLGLSNCVIDLATNAGVVLTDCQSVMISNCWIFGDLAGVVSNNTSTGVDLEMGNSIIGCQIRAVATNPAIVIGANNVGWTIAGNSLKSTVVCVDTAASSRSIAITGNFLSTVATYGLTLRGTDTLSTGNVGNTAVTP